MVKEWNKNEKFVSSRNAELKINICIKGNRLEAKVTRL